MSFTPQGSLSIALSNVRATIAAAASWQAWCGAADADAAAERVHYFALPEPASRDGYQPEELDALRPAAVLTFNTPEWMPRAGFTARWTREGHEQFVDGGSAYVIVNHAVVAEDGDGNERAHADVMGEFVNLLGTLVDDMLDLADPPCLIQSVTLVVEPSRATEVQKGMQGDFCQAMLKVDWGLRPSHY